MQGEHCSSPTRLTSFHSSPPVMTGPHGIAFSAVSFPGQEPAPTVLVVDSDADLTAVFRDVIEQEGFRVVTAPDSDRAFELLESGETPCLILLDLTLPARDLEKFRRRQLALPRIAQIPVVGFSDITGEEREARRLALSFVLRNPVNLHQVLETVAHYCSDPDHIDSSPRESSTIG